MSDRSDGGPAYPLAQPIDVLEAVEGMSLRDWFAGLALVALVSRDHPFDNDFMADAAYRLADAMLKARASA